VPAEGKSVMEVIMAWDRYTVGDLQLISGDTMFDELNGAVKRIRKQYLERFGRSPYLGELLYTLCRIADDYTPSRVEDVTLPPIKEILSPLTSPIQSDQIDPGIYEAGLDEDGVVWIELTATSGSTCPNTPVLRVQVEDKRPQEVLCRYTILSSGISDAAARCLIRLCALNDLLRYNILAPELSVRFEKE